MPVLDDKNLDDKKEITIDQSLVFGETEKEIKTRVPRTYGENIRFLMLDKENVKYFNEGKTILSNLHSNATYSLYDDKGFVAETIKGEALYNNHYDPVSVHQKNAEKMQKQEENKTNDSLSEDEKIVPDNSPFSYVKFNAITELEKNKDFVSAYQNDDENTMQSIVQRTIFKSIDEYEGVSPAFTFIEMSNLEQEVLEGAKKSVDMLVGNGEFEKTPVKNHILAKLYDHSSKVIAEHQDEIALLDARNEDSRNEIAKSSEIIAKYDEIKTSGADKSLPAPVSVFLKLVANHHRNVIDTQQKKIEKRNAKISSHNATIDKQAEKIEMCQKIDVFLSNMKTSEGRKENFITSLNSLQLYALKRNTLKIERNTAKLQQYKDEYNKTTSATVKLELSKKIPKQEKKCDDLLLKQEKLEGVAKKINDAKQLSEEHTEKVIENSYQNIINKATEQPLHYEENLDYIVIDECSKEIDKATRFVEQTNYLKNAEISLEDDYGMIDGIINNGPKEETKIIPDNLKDFENTLSYTDEQLTAFASAEQFIEERNCDDDVINVADITFSGTSQYSVSMIEKLSDEFVKTFSEIPSSQYILADFSKINELKHNFDNELRVSANIENKGYSEEQIACISAMVSAGMSDSIIGLLDYTFTPEKMKEFLNEYKNYSYDGIVEVLADVKGQRPIEIKNSLRNGTYKTKTPKKEVNSNKENKSILTRKQIISANPKDKSRNNENRQKDKTQARNTPPSIS